VSISSHTAENETTTADTTASMGSQAQQAILAKNNTKNANGATTVAKEGA